MENLHKKTIHYYSERQQFEVQSWAITNPDCPNAGYMELLNLVTGVTEKYTIWLGDEDLSYYYVCLNAEDEEDEDETDPVNIDFFDIHLYSFHHLTPDSRINAAKAYASSLRKSGHLMSVQNAFRKLRKENTTHLFDITGCPIPAI